MYSLLFILLWRRKLLLLCGSFLCLIGIWIWAIYYTTTIARSNDKISTANDFSASAQREHLLAKYGFVASDGDGVQFVRPTDYSGFSSQNIVRNRDSSLRLRERQRSFSSFFANKDAVKVLQNLESPSRDEIARRRDVQKLYQATNRQTQYERELHRMVWPK